MTSSRLVIVSASLAGLRAAACELDADAREVVVGDRRIGHYALVIDTGARARSLPSVQARTETGPLVQGDLEKTNVRGAGRARSWTGRWR